MNVIILGAGEGKRLRPLTNDKPKCLVEFFGKTLLERQVSIFRKCGIKDISVVTGYNSDLFENINLELNYINNKKFASTNMLYSLFCAEKKFSDETIVSYGDIIFQEKVLKKLINSKDNFSITIDKNWKKYWSLRFDNPITDAESLKINDEGYITEIGNEIKEITEIQGQYIGLMKFQKSAITSIKLFFKKCQKLYEEEKINILNSNVSFDNSFMTDFLQGLIKNGEKLKSVEINNGWLEFDSIGDYRLHVGEKIKEIFDIND